MAGPLDGTVRYRYRGEHAERKHRHLIAAIYACEDQGDLAYILADHDAELDALWLDYPDYAQAVSDAADEVHAMLTASTVTSEASENASTSENRDTSEQKGTGMFSINTNTGGESGPFLNYKNRAGQGMPDGSWYLRSKDGEDWEYTDMTAAFQGGFVADIYATHDGQLGGSLKLGFIKFTEGAAPERHVWATPLQEEPRRSEEKTSQGGYAWQNMVSFRMATGGGATALFDVSGWSGYKGVMALIEHMNAGFAANTGKAPLVQYTGFRVEGSGQKRLHVPEFMIPQWVDLPDCLKPEAPKIETKAAPESAPAAQPAPAFAPAPAPTPQPAAANGGF